MSTEKKLATLSAGAKMKIYALGALRLTPRGLLLIIALNAAFVLAYSLRQWTGWGSVHIEAEALWLESIIEPSLFVLALRAQIVVMRLGGIMGDKRYERFCGWSGLFALFFCGAMMMGSPPREAVVSELARLEVALRDSPSWDGKDLSAKHRMEWKKQKAQDARAKALAWLESQSGSTAGLSEDLSQTWMRAVGCGMLAAWVLLRAKDIAMGLSWAAAASGARRWRAKTRENILIGGLGIKIALAAMARWMARAASAMTRSGDASQESAWGKLGSGCVKMARACKMDMARWGRQVQEAIVEKGLGEQEEVSALERAELKDKTPEAHAMSKGANRL